MKKKTETRKNVIADEAKSIRHRTFHFIAKIIRTNFFFIPSFSFALHINYV